MDRRIRTYFLIGLSLFFLLIFVVVNDLSYRTELRYQGLQLSSSELIADWHSVLGNIRGILTIVEPLPKSLENRNAQLDLVGVRLDELSRASKGMDQELRKTVENLAGSLRSGMVLCRQILDDGEKFTRQDDLKPEFLDGTLPLSYLLSRDAASELGPKAAFYYFQLVRQLKEMNSFFDTLYSQNLTKLLELISHRVEGLRSGFNLMRLAVLALTVLVIGLMVWQLFQLNAYLRRVVRKTSDELLLTQKNLNEVNADLQNIQFQQSLFSMVTGVSHELNTPLGNALTLTSYLEGGLQQLIAQTRAGQMTKGGWDKFLTDTAEGFSLLHDNLGRMKLQIDTFKLLAAANHDSSPGLVSAHEYTRVRLPQLVELVCPGVSVTTSLEPVQDFLLPVGSLDIVFTELFKNAVIHGETARIQIDLEKEKAYLRIRFRDFGRGVKPEVLSSLAKPFFTTARNQRHMGLGLSIILSLVTNRLHGTLEFEIANPGLVVNLVIPAEQLG